MSNRVDYSNEELEQAELILCNITNFMQQNIDKGYTQFSCKDIINALEIMITKLHKLQWENEILYDEKEKLEFENERLKDYISRDKLKKIYGKLTQELGSYVRDKATPQQERIAGAMNLLNKILEGNYEIWKNKEILL